MLVRAFIVLLSILNLGVAAWWFARDPAPTAAPAETPSGVARLQLVGETGSARPAAPAAVLAASTAAVGAPDAAASVGSQCLRFGPFPSRQAADAASAQLQPLVRSVAVRDATVPTRGWRVLLPPLASLEEAQATAQRISAAGFNDFLVVREGAEANSIALGRYRNEAGARGRMAALAAAGFAARVEPLGAASEAASVYLDVVADDAFDPQRAQAVVPAVQYSRQECAAQR